MFYSMQEAAEKLKMTREQLQQIISEGKLREFRDGANVLFKVDEVQALAPEAAAAEPSEAPAAQEPGIDTAEISLAAEASGEQPAAGVPV